MSKELVDLSVVVPLLNEQQSLAELHQRLVATLTQAGLVWEVWFIDDGSTDGSAAELDRIAAADAHVGVVHFRRNFGKAAALDAGFRRARGRFVCTMDADLQDAPEEIVKLLATLKQEGHDAVSGWKKTRHDPWGKRLPSKLFNFVVSLVSGLRLHDFNCGLKLYRAEAVAELRLYGEMHRFVPMLLQAYGFSVGELAVRHEARRFGHSKYGWRRFFAGFFDLLTVLLNTRYRSRPLHLFGFFGLFLASVGGLALTYLSVLWLLGERPIGQRPLLFFGLLLVMVGVQFVSTGLLGELITRQRQRPDSEANYVIRRSTEPRVLAAPAPEGAAKGDVTDEQRAQVRDDEPDRPLPRRAIS